MDKKNLYYVILEGTNQREMNTVYEPFIADKEAAEKRIKLNNQSDVQANHDRVDVIISIADYEKKFSNENDIPVVHPHPESDRPDFHPSEEDMI